MFVYLIKEANFDRRGNPQNQVIIFDREAADDHARVQTLKLRKKCGCEDAATTELPRLLELCPTELLELGNCKVTNVSRGQHSRGCSSMEQIEVWKIPVG